MKKIISFVGLFAVLGVGIGDAHGVAMSAQVRRLLQEKQEKIEQLEKCEGKKQGWMIAGISTIGLTAVGVGVNIAQASKSNRLSDEIEMEKSTLERHQNELNRIQNDIAAEQLRQRREDCKKQSGKRWNDSGYCEDVPGTGGGNGATVQVIEPTPMPALDNPDGEIGKPCSDNGGGIWTEKTDGTKKCSNVNGLVLCECVKGTTATPSGGMGDGNVVSNEQGTERKIGGPCVEEDMKKLYVSSGHYIRNEQTRLGTRCEPGNVLCACFADSCEDGFELVYSNGKNQGWCRKTSGGSSSSSSSNTEKSSTSTATSGGTNSKSVTSNNGEKGSSSVANTDGNTGTNSSVSSSSNTEKSSASMATSGGTNSKSVTSNNGEKGSSSVANTDGNTGTNSSVSSSSNTEKSSASMATSGGTNSKSVTSNNGEKGSSSVAKTGGNTGPNSSSSSASSSGSTSTSTTKTGSISSSSVTSEIGDCVIGEPNKILPEGCVCDASKGLVERWVTTMFGGRGNQKECKCDSGTQWNGRECQGTQTVQSTTAKSTSKSSNQSNSSSASSSGSTSTSTTKTGSISSSSVTSEIGDCVIGEPNKILPEGCVCDASKGLVERYLTTMGGKRSKDKECKCDSGTRWDGRENMCI